MKDVFNSVAVVALCVGLAAAPNFAAAAEGQSYFYAPDGIALSGYDAVSYFKQGRAVPGTPENSLMWRGVTWFFATPESEMSFEMDPHAYAPQFGGYCAYGVAEGTAASGAPDAFVIFQGRLYLMHTVDMVSKVQSEMPEIVKEAQGKWPAVLGR